ncbi:MAG: hypothetical protein A2855_03000 [Candidatus Liptonbacteria bacterium RIFCSPHIGHO2_01_FULL_57_28]|uniref:Uncharacterized protein n=1 Tax=Candidatus Liptonbacteria bacterium RIFCSPHIGHO2_01_FULL_57_28 TaxID=1798647 RepID=A0A1G2C8W7_9BACT|nr:MAG: hypothetical protein A2855_03000 [Candidatus Liptonbacteria bacterium RIFCSPHIGHO2_01_FULL_57_28]
MRKHLLFLPALTLLVVVFFAAPLALALAENITVYSQFEPPTNGAYDGGNCSLHYHGITGACNLSSPTFRAGVASTIQEWQFYPYCNTSAGWPDNVFNGRTYVVDINTDEVIASGSFQIQCVSTQPATQAESRLRGSFDAPGTLLPEHDYFFIYGTADGTDINKAVSNGRQGNPGRFAFSLFGQGGPEQVGQYSSGGTVNIAEGATTTENSITFKAILQAGAPGPFQLQVEVQPFVRGFDNIASASSDFLAAGEEASVTVDLADGKYHWRTRMVDQEGHVSKWEEFGTPGNVDLQVRHTPFAPSLNLIVHEEAAPPTALYAGRCDSNTLAYNYCEFANFTVPEDAEVNAMTWWPYCDQFRGWGATQRVSYIIVRLSDGSFVTDGDAVINCPNSGGDPQIADAVAQMIPVSSALLQYGVTYRAILAAYPGTYPPLDPFARPDMLWGVQPDPVRSSFQIWGPSPETAKEPVIIVPGIMGSRLNRVSDGEEVWPNVFGMISPFDSYLNELRLSTTTGLELPGKDMNPTSVIDREYPFGIPRVAYGNLRDLFLNNGYTTSTPNKSYFEFPYDWRLDIREEVSNFSSVVAEAFSNSPTGKINIVAHSMGGLLVKEFLRTADPSIIDKIVFVGVPHLGSPKAFNALNYGDNLGFEFGPVDILNRDRVKIITQNMPGVYELLPSKKYFEKDPYYVVDFRNNNLNSLDYSETKTFMLEKPSDARNEILIDQAQEFHDSLDGFTSTSFQMYNIVGCQNPSTIGTFVIRDDGVEPLSTNGDGTVPLMSARNPSDNSADYYVSHYETGINHAGLVRDSKVLDIIASLINGQPPTSFPTGISDSATTCDPPPAVGPETTISFATFSPVALHIYDSQGRHTGPTSAGDLELGIPGSSYQQIGEHNFAFVPAGEAYRVIVDGLAPGEFTMKVKGYNGSTLTRTAAYVAVPVQSASTLAELAFISFDGNLGLNLDENGDDVTDAIIEPEAILSGSSAGDIVPPVVSFNMPQEVIIDSPITIDFLSSDELSGMSTTTATLDGVEVQNGMIRTVATIGEHVLSVRAVDNAGNLRIADFHFDSVYQFGGFLPPLKTDGTGIYNQGRVLPVKFQLVDVAGNFISTTIATMTLTKISNGTAGTEEIPLAVGNADTGNAFRYDSTSNNYVYNLSTDAMTPGTWRLKVYLDDGKQYEVEISIKQ